MSGIYTKVRPAAIQETIYTSFEGTEKFAKPNFAILISDSVYLYHTAWRSQFYLCLKPVQPIKGISPLTKNSLRCSLCPIVHCLVGDFNVVFESQLLLHF